MKVLKNNYNKESYKENKIEKPYPRTYTCDKCRSELQYEESDLIIGFLGAAHICCPLCNHNNMLDGNENDITLTYKNVEYPTHFHNTSVETGAVDRNNNEEVKKEIKNAIEFFRNNKDLYAWSSQSGSLYVSVVRCESDEDYKVTVSNDYYSTEIPFEKEDY